MNRDFRLTYLFFNNTSLSDSSLKNWIVIICIVCDSHCILERSNLNYFLDIKNKKLNYPSHFYKRIVPIRLIKTGNNHPLRSGGVDKIDFS